MSSPKVQYVFDGDNLVNRMWFAMREPESGLAEATERKLRSLVRELSYPIDGIGADFTKDIVIAWDSHRLTRHENIKDYKAGRNPKPELFYEQMVESKDLLSKLDGIESICVDGWEADDVCASVAHQTDAEFTYIISSDKDTFQMIRDVTSVITINGTVTLDSFTKKYGFAPSLYPSYAGLVGDKSDNLPGVEGFGPKRANTVICAGLTPSTLEPDLLKSILSKKLCDALIAQVDHWQFNIDQMTLRKDLIVFEDEEDYVF